MKQWKLVLLCYALSLPVLAQTEINPAETPVADAIEIVDTAATNIEAAVTEPVLVPETPVVSPTEAVTPPTEEPVAEVATPAPTFAVILPERIDHEWYWLLYTDTSQHIVQSAIEKALIRAGVEVVDLNAASLPSYGSDLNTLMSVGFAVEAGKQIKADYVVTGQATAIKASEGFAYGVNVFRSQVEVVAKIVRVSDGKIITIEDASAQEGGQSSQGAGQAGLKKAGTQVASKIARAARGLMDAEPATR